MTGGRGGTRSRGKRKSDASRRCSATLFSALPVTFWLVPSSPLSEDFRRWPMVRTSSSVTRNHASREAGCCRFVRRSSLLAHRLATALSTVLFACHFLLAAAVMSPMPYRPGYGIGSWMPPDVVKGMKSEAFLRSQILLTINMDSDATSLARELQIAMNGLKNSLNGQQGIPDPMSADEERQFMDRITKYRTDAWEMKLTAYERLFDGMGQQMAQLTAASAQGGVGGGMTGNAKGAFSTFANGIESPIDWRLSNIVMKDRSFDSITIDSHFIKIADNAQDSSSSARVAGSASQVAAFVSSSLGSMAASGDAAVAASSKATRTMSQKNVEATLILTALATHRHVKQFDALHLIPQNVRAAWNFYFPNSAIRDPEADIVGFETAFAESLGKQDAASMTDRINLLTEVFQGSALVGMVHFVSHEGSSSSQESSMSSSSVGDRLKLGAWIGSMTGSRGAAENAANEIASMASDAGLDIVFDIVVVGYMPTVKSQIMKYAVTSFAKFDPTTFDAGQLMPSATTVASQAQNKRESDAKSVIKATVQSLNEVEQDNPVLGIQTFMDAFDDYAEACKSFEAIGAPVGMNVKQFTKMDVMKLLAQKYLSRAQAAGTTKSGDVGT